MAHSAEKNLVLLPIAHNQILLYGRMSRNHHRFLLYGFNPRSGPEHISKSAASGPWSIGGIEEFASIFETALDHESGGKWGASGEITLDQKTHATGPL
jgi:hypothetical protein